MARLIPFVLVFLFACGGELTDENSSTSLEQSGFEQAVPLAYELDYAKGFVVEEHGSDHLVTVLMIRYRWGNIICTWEMFQLLRRKEQRTSRYLFHLLRV